MRTAIAIVATSMLAGACSESKGQPTSVPGDTLVAGNKAVKRPATAQLRRAKSRGAEHAVYSLLDNRLHAHLIRDGGLFIPAGSPGFAKYMRYRKAAMPWKIRQTMAGRGVATMASKAASLRIPLTAQQAASGTLYLRIHAGAEHRLSVRVNGQREQEIALSVASGVSTLEAKVPTGLLRAGENDLMLFASAPLSVEWIQVGGARPDKPDTIVAKTEGSVAKLLLPKGGGLAYYVMVPEKGLVTGDLGQPSCEVAVSAVDDSGQRLEGTLRGLGAAVDLAKLAGKPVRLELVTTGCPAATLSKAALIVPGAASKFMRPPAKPKHVVLWIMDSLRADRVKIFHKTARAEVPTFERLATNSAVFLQTYVQGNESRSSHASIWSSTYPVNHRMFSAKDKLGSKWITVDEVAKQAGMTTIGVSGNGYVIPRRGFGTSWDKYRNHIHDRGGLKGADIMEKGLEFAKRVTKPWLLYLGTIDTHVSWRVKEPWFSKYDSKPYSGYFKKTASGADIGKAAGVKGDAWPWGKANRKRDIERIVAIYDSNVSYQDDLLDQMMARFKEWKIDKDTMIVVSADHGDEQWEHGRVGHGGSLRETLVHVPLLIHYPPLFPGGSIPEGAEVIDIVPTIADALGVKADPSWQGQSLIPLANGEGRGYPRLSLASHSEASHAARIGGWKIRVSGGARPQLYHIAKQYNEKTDLVTKRPIARRFVADPLWMLRAYNPQWRKSKWGNAANVTAAFAADLEAR